MNDHACILIWDAHTRMRHNIVPYAYGISHTRMGQYTHMGQNTYTFFVPIARFWRLLIGFNNYIRGVDQNRRHRGHATSLQKVNPRDLDDGRSDRYLLCSY